MVDGIPTDLQAFYGALEGQTQPAVAYRVFWKRVRMLEGRLLELEAGIGRKVALTRELLSMAALSCPVEWRHGWGASRLSPLEHEGRVHPTRVAFVHAAGRMADRKMIGPGWNVVFPPGQRSSQGSIPPGVASST
ncbi:hypothetical protein LAZ41_03475 [Cereibacter sphaeroides]|nr:hypothetical protein [Cereibacter sphaeroides]